MSVMTKRTVACDEPGCNKRIHVLAPEGWGRAQWVESDRSTWIDYASQGFVAVPRPKPNAESSNNAFFDYCADHAPLEPGDSVFATGRGGWTTAGVIERIDSDGFYVIGLDAGLGPVRFKRSQLTRARG